MKTFPYLLTLKLKNKWETDLFFLGLKCPSLVSYSDPVKVLPQNNIISWTVNFDFNSHFCLSLYHSILGALY